MGYAFRLCSKGRRPSLSPHGRGRLGGTVPAFKSHVGQQDEKDQGDGAGKIVSLTARAEEESRG